MSDVKKCYKCGQMFYNVGEYNQHRNQHIRGEIKISTPLPRRADSILSVTKGQDIKSVKIDDPIKPGEKAIPNAPDLLGNNMQQQPMQQPIYNQFQQPIQSQQPQPIQQPMQQFIQPQPQVPQLQMNPSKPIVLKYIYEGTCPNDNNAIMTIETDIGGDHYVMAICSVCQKQWQSRKVIDLNKQQGGDQNASQNQQGKRRVFRTNTKRSKGKENNENKSNETKNIIKRS